MAKIKLRECSLDIEATGLLDHTAFDFSSTPYVLKDSFTVHCAVLQDINTKEVFVLYNDPNKRSPKKISELVKSFGIINSKIVYLDIKHLSTVLSRCCRLIAHNGLGYDYPALSAWLEVPYEVGTEGLAFENGQWPSRKDHLYDSWDNNPINLDDTMILSQLLNPDRFGGHSLEEWGVRKGRYKVNIENYVEENLEEFLGDELSPKYLEFTSQLELCINKTQKKKLLKELYFKTFTPHMLYYCIIDTIICTEVYESLMWEWGSWDWNQSYNTECMVSDIIFKQERLGFKFDKELGEWCYKDLSEKMEEISNKVEPLLPLKALNKKEQGIYSPPKNQVNQDRTVSAGMQKWIDKHEGVVTKSHTITKGVRVIKEFVVPDEIEFFGKKFKFPLEPDEYIIEGLPMTLKDHIPLKEYIVSLGWRPSVWAETDLTMKSTKKIKKTKEEYQVCIEEYLLKKRTSPFLKHILYELDLKNYSDLVRKLSTHDLEKPLKVPTSPKYTVGQEKEIDPNLLLLGEQVDFVKDVVYWLTYNHRRNAVYSKEEDSETKSEDSGWLVNPRLQIDGRIPTPAKTLGASSGRMQHINVANIPRVSSLYGEYMRRLFGVDTEHDYQIGYDADGLEARTEAHYCYDYDDSKHSYCTALVSPKPYDLHTLRSIAKGISRDDSKTMKYSLTYGATAKKVAKQFGWDIERGNKEVESFWEDAEPLAKLKHFAEIAWTKNNKQFISGVDGRKLVTRSKHSLLNALLQSCGAIAMKVAMIWADRELKSFNLVGNIFTEHIYSRPTTNQMIAYHK